MPVVIIPALNEERTVAEVIGRVPAAVGGHPVKVLGINDGSTDLGIARGAGATARPRRLRRTLSHVLP